MENIEFVEELDDNTSKMIGIEFDKYSASKGLNCDYTPFNFVAKDGDKIIGIITGHAYYNEVHISDLIILEEYRKKHIGSKLVKAVEDFHRNKGYDFISLNTYDFQAPGFYKKNGYEIEYTRECKENKKLTKYFLVKKY